MNFDISMHCTQPDWLHWRRLGSITLKEAILLSLDICPDWYDGYIVHHVHNLDNVDYPSRLTESEEKSVFKVFDYIESEYSTRLQVVQSWAFNQDWIIEKKDFTPKDINENMLVDLKKFFQASFNQMGFCNEYDEIPSDLYVNVGLKDDSGLNHLSPISSSQSDWKLKPESELKRFGGYRDALYETVKELFKENPNQKPSARLVKAKWDKNKPSDIYEVLTDEFKYLNNFYVVKTVSWISLGKAISNLLIPNNSK